MFRPPVSHRPVAAPTVIAAPPESVQSLWRNGVTLLVGPDGRGYAVGIVGSADHSLVNELRVGAIGRAVRLTMGPPTRSVTAPAWTAWVYDRSGIAFYLGPGSGGPDGWPIVRIDVFGPTR